MTGNPRDLSRRNVIVGALGLAGVAGANWSAMAQVAKPASPLSLNIIDAAGNLALTQPAFDSYRKEHPDLVGRMTFTKAPSPELPGKIRAQQAANRVDIDLVIIGPDALSAGLADDIYLDVVGQHAKSLPDLQAIYLDPAWRMQQLAKGTGHRRQLLPVRAPAGIRARSGQDAAHDRSGTARLGQAEPEEVHLRASGEFGTRPNLPDGSPLPAR